MEAAAVNAPARPKWLRTKRPRRPGEWLVEKGIFAVSLSAIITILLIFLFVAREALPVALGRVNSSLQQETLSVDQLDKIPPAQLRRYLELTPQQFQRMDRETLQALMEVKIEAQKEASTDKDAGVNSASWRYLLAPHQWTGYSRPEYIWQPVSPVPKFNLVPLFIGSLKLTVIALAIGVPLALAAAIYVSQLAGRRTREWLKPGIELLAGIPSVVLGFFALIVLATLAQKVFGYQSRLNAFVAGLALALAVIPLVFSIAEDALGSVPRSYVHGALALGASRWRAAWTIVLPAALPGVFAAVVLGFGRAIGETMIVLMASGNASILSASLFDSARSMTATIAAELAEAVFDGTHYRILFLIGLLLFIITFISNLVADLIIHQLKRRLEGKA